MQILLNLTLNDLKTYIFAIIDIMYVDLRLIIHPSTGGSLLDGCIVYEVQPGGGYVPSSLVNNKHNLNDGPLSTRGETACLFQPWPTLI